MELGFDWRQTAADVAETETGTNHLPDHRIHASFNSLYTRCCCVNDPDKFRQERCKYFKRSTHDFRCMYQKFNDFDMCDKLTSKDGEELN